jgi:tetratricopeptide (TPR) repeat protein
MPIDPYSPCPGGTGKKIKFCCSELVGDLEQLERLTEGQQYAAALAEVEKLSQRYPGRACLMAHRTRLQLATKKFAEAAAGSMAFLEACPDNPVALGQAAVTEAVVGRMQEAMALFDKARDKASENASDSAGEEVPQDLLRTAQTLVQAAAQTGHPGCAQGIVEWLIDKSLGTEEERQVLASIVGSAGVPPALRTKLSFEASPADSPYRFEFESAIKAAAGWRLSKALAAFRSLNAVAGESPELFTNIAILCEMLARPYEASEAWLAVARLRSGTPDDAVEATGRAIAMETEADPDRSPGVKITSIFATLPTAAGETGGGIELLEDKLRHDGRFDVSTFDRSAWVSRGAAPPHSVWRVYAPSATGTQPGSEHPDRLLASLMIFGRQTDREPETVLQGFEPDVAEAKPVVEQLLGCTFAAAAETGGRRLPTISPTAWLQNTQFRVNPAELSKEPTAAGGPSVVDRLLARQRQAVWDRFLAVWPETPLPELLGKTPRQAAAESGKEPARRVEALISEGEAASRQPEVSAAWTAVRGIVGLPSPAPIRSAQPLEEVPPLRWHRVVLDGLPIDQLRALFLTSLDAGFDPAAARAALAIVARPDAEPQDRWEAYGLLEDRAATSLEKLEIIGKLRALAKELGANDGMLDVAELRVLLSRADEPGIMRLLNHLQREHARDQKVIAALAEVLGEAGVDLAALAAQSAAAGQMPGGPAGPPIGGGQPAASDSGRIWTPGGGQAGPAGEKKSIWTPE